jgi:hypothetical protein
VRTHVSIMLAGFCVGLAVAGVGAPRRLARQMFAVTEGFLGPLFFVWLGRRWIFVRSVSIRRWSCSGWCSESARSRSTSR